MSLDKIHQLISSLAKTVDDSHKIATPILSVKLARAIEEYPHDQTLGAMFRVMEKLADNNTIFIRRSELKDLYKRLYSNNTKFAELFSEELGEFPRGEKSGDEPADHEPCPYCGYDHGYEPEAAMKWHSQHPEITRKYEADNYGANPVDIYSESDPILANALNSVFDKDIPLKMYSQDLANKAKYSVGTTLDAWSLRPTSLDVSDGNDKFLVLKADYETPKGVTSFYVPVEIHNNKVDEASVFVGNSGPQDLNYINVKKYVTSNAGSKLTINGSLIMEVLVKASSENREISGAELALIKFNSAKQDNADFFQNQIVGQKIDAQVIPDIQLPKSDEFISFEKQFTSNAGLAAFKFGNDKVKIARENIIRDLVSLGHKNPQIVIADHNDNTIFYSVVLDRVAFTVPVKINNGNIVKPSIMLCNGSILDFSKDGIDKLYVGNESDYKAAAVASPLFELSAGDLVNNIRVAIADGNHTKAEDALNVLANSGNEKAYATGFQIFLNGLGNKTSSEPECKCTMIIKNNTSQHPICGHTGLPIHKVYQDKYGNCLPLYRRGMEETYEGASFMNAKIFG